jgi:hypothetical protein
MHETFGHLDDGDTVGSPDPTIFIHVENKGVIAEFWIT